MIADTGVISGHAIQADFTVSFIGLKQGMFTAQAKDVCGEIVFSDLAVPEEVFDQVKTETRLINNIDYSLLPKRKASSHKGCFGHVLIVGGNEGMPGAVILAATAALRAGAGLLTIITVAKNLPVISSAVPEAIIKTCEVDSVIELFTEDFVNTVTHVAIGMGLGQDNWSSALLERCVQLNKPMLVDADGLNLLAKSELVINSELIITPHPGEAARLLMQAKEQVSQPGSAGIQNNRFHAIRVLFEVFDSTKACVVILKGSGTLIFDGQTCLQFGKFSNGCTGYG